MTTPFWPSSTTSPTPDPASSLPDDDYVADAQSKSGTEVAGVGSRQSIIVSTLEVDPEIPINSLRGHGRSLSMLMKSWPCSIASSSATWVCGNLGIQPLGMSRLVEPR
jgi:hypothetical protein